MIIDPITLEVVTQAMIALVREMRANVCRTASSVAIYDAKDFSCGLFGPDGQVIAQSEDIGSHVVPMPWSVREAMKKMGAGLKPGDVLILNDPYSGGTHLNDVTVVYPVFENGKLIYFPAVRAHWADVGGMVPGSLSGKATEIYQEGLRIPPMKIMEEGEFNQGVLDLVLANMRVPEERLSDLNSGISACKVAERRIHEICARYGTDTVLAAAAQNLNRAEERMRNCILALPDGEYFYEDYLETFMGNRFEPLLLPLKLTVSGDKLVADFTGASRQVPFPVNSTAAVSAAGVFIAVKSVFDPDAPMNQGSFRPIEVITPPATIVNVQRPAPAGSHGEIRKRVIATVVGALSQVVPDLVAGDTCRTSFHNLFGGYDDKVNREWVHYEWSAGGNGGFAEGDGPDVMAPIDWGDLVTVQSTEVIETRMPLFVEYSRMALDSGGAGKSRGGLALQRKIEMLADNGGTYSLLSDGAVVPAFGVRGGMSGLPVAAWLSKPGAEPLPFDTPGKVSGAHVARGDAVIVRSAGGGGYGDPLDRDPDLVAFDMANGLVSEAVARDVYGVVISANGEADRQSTSQRREEIKRGRRTLDVQTEHDGYLNGAVSKRRICRLNPTDAAMFGLSDGDLLELDGGHAAPLRAWAYFDPSVPTGKLPLDLMGQKIIKASSGSAVTLRRISAGLV